MKKILLLSSLLVGGVAVAQTPMFNKTSIDFGVGVNKSIHRTQAGAANGLNLPHIELGVRHMLNNKYGVYGGVMFEGYKSTVAGKDLKTNAIYITSQGALNLTNMIDFSQITKKIGFYGHAGPSLVFFTAKDYAMDMAIGFTTGIAMQYKATSKLAIKGDISMCGYLQQDRSLDLQTTAKGGSGLNNGLDGLSGNVTLGVNYYLGDQAEHADWTPTQYGDMEAVAALKAKIEKAEKDMMDDDKDGVPNYLDQEPNTAAGATVDTKGKTVKVEKIVDMDMDGVLDVNDFCPTIKGVQSANGCPDGDNDGVYDFVDKCPKAAGVASEAGCPVISKATVDVLKKAEGIQFDNGKATITKKSLPNLDAVAKIMLANPSYNLMINGHTDNVGDPAKNLKLSEDRTKAVKAYLMGKGVAESRMTATGYGDTQPKMSNATAKGKAANRRVEFIIKFQE